MTGSDRRDLATVVTPPDPCAVPARPSFRRMTHPTRGDRAVNLRLAGNKAARHVNRSPSAAAAAGRGDSGSTTRVCVFRIPVVALGHHPQVLGLLEVLRGLAPLPPLRVVGAHPPPRGAELLVVAPALLHQLRRARAVIVRTRSEGRRAARRGQSQACCRGKLLGAVGSGLN